MGVGTIYDYSQPLNTQAPPSNTTEEDEADGLFGQARESFKTGMYQDALKSIDLALVKTPQDATLHEFRALVLFALGRFDEAAAVIYPVLSVGPGWSWETLVGLYPDVSVYTPQLRALEGYRTQQNHNAAAAFLLSYHYLTMGHKENARSQLEAVVKLQPDDRLAQQLLTTLTTKPGDPAAALAAKPQAQPAAPTQQFPIAGTWSASPDSASTITLEIKADGNFVWRLTQKDQPRSLSGTSTIGGTGMLTLASTDAGVMVGQVTWKDAEHFNFRLVGARADDAGIEFSRRP
jgi:Tfp pilus assembly protein PilF